MNRKLWVVGKIVNGEFVYLARVYPKTSLPRG